MFIIMPEGPYVKMRISEKIGGILKGMYVLCCLECSVTCMGKLDLSVSPIDAALSLGILPSPHSWP